jgi:Holliday junction resolvase RusA-like endonuclease
VSERVEFTVPGTPVAWARARLAGRRHFTDPKTAAYKLAVGTLARADMAGRPPFCGPVALHVRAVFAVPKSWPKWRREDALAGLVVPTGKPDWDNVGKGVSDALNGIVYEDDAQVYAATVVKRYGPTPHVRVIVTRSAGDAP